MLCFDYQTSGKNVVVIKYCVHYFLPAELTILLTEHRAIHRQSLDTAVFQGSMVVEQLGLHLL